MMKKPPWSEWLTVALAVIAAAAAVGSAIFSADSADSAERQSIASEEMVERTKAPDLDAAAYYLRTPVPDPRPFIRPLGSDGDTSLGLAIYNPFIGSTGVWHVTVQNNGDAEPKTCASAPRASSTLGIAGLPQEGRSAGPD